ncbi:MAG: hypothetical protein WCS73_09630 [Lentisphaeria bacterium]
MDEIVNLLNAIGIEHAYHHFAEGESPDPPFICYLLPNSDNYSADNQAYYKANEVHIELYIDEKSPTDEQKVESVLDENGIYYEKYEAWIESEKMYQILYIFEMGA